jgi:hypothetical protein
MFSFSFWYLWCIIHHKWKRYCRTLKTQNFSFFPSPNQILEFIKILLQCFSPPDISYLSLETYSSKSKWRGCWQLSEREKSFSLRFVLTTFQISRSFLISFDNLIILLSPSDKATCYTCTTNVHHVHLGTTDFRLSCFEQTLQTF